MSAEIRVAVEGLQSGRQLLETDAARYVAKVHRKRVGEFIVLFDPKKGVRARAEILEDRLPRVWVQVGQVELVPQENVPVTLIQALGKADKPEQAVRDATALGVETIVFAETNRTVARSGGDTRAERLRRVSEQVARQCGRGDLPNVIGPLPLVQALGPQVHSLDLEPNCLKLVCAWHPEGMPLLLRFKEFSWSTQRVVVLIGPEGGLAESEVHLAMQAGFLPVSLGPYVLRTEAACAFVLSALRASADAASL